jgi:hypothetical protein
MPSSLLPVKQQGPDIVLPDNINEAEHNIIKKSNISGSGLTDNQQLKQDAMLWAEFLYSEYKREKALSGEAQTKPTHYDNPDA